MLKNRTHIHSQPKHTLTSDAIRNRVKGMYLSAAQAHYLCIALAYYHCAENSVTHVVHKYSWPLGQYLCQLRGEELCSYSRMQRDIKSLRDSLKEYGHYYQREDLVALREDELSHKYFQQLFTPNKDSADRIYLSAAQLKAADYVLSFANFFDLHAAEGFIKTYNQTPLEYLSRLRHTIRQGRKQKQ